MSDKERSALSSNTKQLIKVGHTSTTKLRANYQQSIKIRATLASRCNKYTVKSREVDCT